MDGTGEHRVKEKDKLHMFSQMQNLDLKKKRIKHRRGTFWRWELVGEGRVKEESKRGVNRIKILYVWACMKIE
jgi:hypothetical protein